MPRLRASREDPELGVRGGTVWLMALAAVRALLYARHGLFEIGLVDDVVALENRPGPVPGDGHGNLFGDAVPAHVADPRPSQIVEE